MGHVSLVAPAPFMEARQLLAPLTGLKPLANAVASIQLAAGETVGLRLGERLVGVLGFYPFGEGDEECFLACLPGAELGRAIVPLQRAGRLILLRRLHHPSVRRIVALVAHGNDAGQRLARLAGFSRRRVATAPGAGFDLWEMTG